MLKLNFSYTGQTLLRDWWKQVKAHFSEVEDYVNSLETNIKNSITSESNERKNADKALSDSLNTEASARADADNGLSDKLTEEKNARATSEAALSRRIDALAASSHRHMNYSVLEGISQNDVAAWNDNTNHISGNTQRIEYLEEACRTFMTNMREIYSIWNINLYDGGLDGEIQTGPPLDGGDFEENTVYDDFDCGMFGDAIFATTMVVDGGSY